ncbi:hypothetical protein chiPu_0001764 [Chiloscyllium punctatum]|uniref:Uncharacterized protein n=1 Tax=Chiloscyllium punctatum TaxID=137246 RepID=A0A401RZ57_CHIPU|nr:hypothetical protein [Chiloscyllium punctatum]
MKWSRLLKRIDGTQFRKYKAKPELTSRRNENVRHKNPGRREWCERLAWDSIPGLEFYRRTNTYRLHRLKLLSCQMYMQKAFVIGCDFFTLSVASLDTVVDCQQIATEKSEKLIIYRASNLLRNTSIIFDRPFLVNVTIRVDI